MTKPRIVIADDEGIIRLDLAEVLSGAGYEVVASVADGQAAIDAIVGLHPDLAILDVKMPLVAGTDVAAAVRDLCPVMLLTAFAQQDIVEQAAHAGVMGYLVKPFTESEVLAAIPLAMARYADMVALRTDRDALADALETRKVLDRAKGLLQSKLNLSEPESFRWLQKAAMDRRLSIREVAQSVLTELGK
jgi:response regulator NasT